jgi:hypothetical protein
MDAQERERKTTTNKLILQLTIDITECIAAVPLRDVTTTGKSFPTTKLTSTKREHWLTQERL